VLVEGLIIDRYRLLPPQPSDAWLSENLARDLIAWLEPRIGWLESPGSGWGCAGPKPSCARSGLGELDKSWCNRR